MTSNASFLSINENSGVIFGLSTQDDVGVWWVNASVQDGNGGIDNIFFQITIKNINDIPEPINKEIQITLNEDENTTLNLDEYFVDEENDLLTYTSISSENILILIEGNIAFIYPKENWFGVEYITFIANDSRSSNFMELELKINSVNDPPIIRKINAWNAYYVDEYQLFSSTVEDNDLINGDKISYRWTSNISGEIGNEASINVSLPLGLHNITLIVEDIEGLKSSLSIDVLIVENNPIEHNHDDKKENHIFFIILLIIPIIIIIGIIFVYFNSKRKKSNKEIEAPIPFKKAPAIDSLSVSNSELLMDPNDAERGKVDMLPGR